MNQVEFIFGRRHKWIGSFPPMCETQGVSSPIHSRSALKPIGVLGLLETWAFL